MNKVHRVSLAVVAFAAVCLAALTVEVRVDNETVPSGGLIQLKVGLTDPHPISTGKMSAGFDSGFFDSIDGISLFSPTGDVAGAAVVQGTQIGVR